MDPTNLNYDVMEEEFAYSMGVQAFIFGFPSTIVERERRIRLNPQLLKRMQGR